jgi:hypothetical protein
LQIKFSPYNYNTTITQIKMFTKVLGLATAFAAATSALPGVTPSQSASSGGSTTAPSSSGNSTTSGGGGGVTVLNHMNQTLYGWSVADNADVPMITLPVGGSYSESWRLNPDDGGISIKLSTAQNQDNILQFEYTLVDPVIYWDLSCINMGTASLFTNAGFAVSSDNAKCDSATCAAGDSNCAAAYLYPTDDQATHGCDASTHMTLTLGGT